MENVQAMRFHHVNQPTGTYAMHGNVYCICDNI